MEQRKGQLGQLKGYGARVKTKLLLYPTRELRAVTSSPVHGAATKEQDFCDKRTRQTSSHRPPKRSDED